MPHALPGPMSDLKHTGNRQGQIRLEYQMQLAPDQHVSAPGQTPIARSGTSMRPVRRRVARSGTVAAPGQTPGAVGVRGGDGPAEAARRAARRCAALIATESSGVDMSW